MAKILNFFEKFVIKRLAKKIVKLIPELKEKGLEIIKNKTPELLDEINEKIEETVLQFIKEHTNQ